MSYQGKLCVITGAASGMGREVLKQVAAEGARIIALDVKEVEDKVEKFIRIDLGNKDSIDEALAQIPDGIDALFHVAGIPGVTQYDGKGFGPMDVIRINYAGARRFVEGCIPKMNENTGIVTVASIAGSQWRKSIPAYKELLAINDFDEIVKYVEARVDDPVFTGGDPKLNKPYVCSKELLAMYTASRSWTASAKHIRMNCVCPGPTVTPMHKNFLKIVGKQEGDKMPTSPCGRESEPAEQASVMVFLNSDAASYVSGEVIGVDYGIGGAMFNGIQGIC